jgi:NADH dehydrogenase [ubiquinone] 1 alpha subcomplex assembly factor 7
VSALLDELRQVIALEGPISLERYMSICLGHPVHGYYMTRDPFGARGDFTTSPEISQMFGELIGLWAAEVWRLMGSPRQLRLVELGPGRGTLMADLLRAVRIVPEFSEALRIHLIETSPALRARQQEKLLGSSVPIVWHESFADVPQGPVIVIANEFFDAIPITQFVKTERGWHERLIGLDADGRLAFGLAPEAQPEFPATGSIGDVLERPAAGVRLIAEIARRMVNNGGAALIIDYGYSGPAFGDTLQAVKGHTFVDTLSEPGEADLTSHVDFAKLADTAVRIGAAVHGPVTQGDFLRAVGIEARARALQARATPAQATDIASALKRLSGPGREDMGALFKALAVSDPHLTCLPGFATSNPS